MITTNPRCGALALATLFALAFGGATTLKAEAGSARAGARVPSSWSPDGRRIAFVRDRLPEQGRPAVGRHAAFHLGFAAPRARSGS